MTSPELEPINIILSDQTGLSANKPKVWVAGWINGGLEQTFKVLQQDGTFGNADPHQTMQTVVVQANQGWQQTNVIIVSPSKEDLTPAMTVSCISGMWTADPQTNDNKLYDGAGCPKLSVPHDQTKYPFVDVPMGALIGRVNGNTGTAFVIGNGPYLMPAGFSGPLELCINDDLDGVYGAGLTDNQGSLTVQIVHQGLPFYPVSSVPKVTLSELTNGNNRLIFVAAPSQPAQLPIGKYAPLGYTMYPYPNPPGIAAPGPFDVFEFGYAANADLTAVNGFGLNLSFSVNGEEYGAPPTISRQQIGEAYKQFVENEAATFPAASAFKELLYDGAMSYDPPSPPPANPPKTPIPPNVDNQYFAITDPNDMLVAKYTLNNSYDGPLATYWDGTLTAFFKPGNYLSINLGTSDRIYSGQSTKTGGDAPVFTLTNAAKTVSYKFYQPPAGYQGAQYVFQQTFGDLTPEGKDGDAGLLQDTIWEALCRGVAQLGVETTSITNGESTGAWNDWRTWYPDKPVYAYHLYAKFLHYATIDGTDSRQAGNGPPIFYNNAAYGFSMDENPIGPYKGPTVPAETGAILGGSTIQLVIGRWST